MNDYVVRIPQQLPILLQAFRKEAKLSQAQVAALLGVTQQTVSDLERNIGDASVSRLMRVMGVLGLELVLRRKPDPEQMPSQDETDPKTGAPIW